MIRFDKTLMAALLAGTALIAYPAAAQDADGESPSMSEGSDNSAKGFAPGQQMKDGEVDSAKDAAPGQRMKSGEIESATEAAPGQMKKDTVDPDPDTDDGLTDEQEAAFRAIIGGLEVNLIAPPDMDLTVGAVVPGTVELTPLPAEVVAVVPEWEGFDFFVTADNQIVVVEPATREVVTVVSG